MLMTLRWGCKVERGIEIKYEANKPKMPALARTAPTRLTTSLCLSPQPRPTARERGALGRDLAEH